MMTKTGGFDLVENCSEDFVLRTSLALISTLMMISVAPLDLGQTEAFFRVFV